MFFRKNKKSTKKQSAGLLSNLFNGLNKKNLQEKELFEQWESTLLEADLGVKLSQNILDIVKQKYKENPEDISTLLHEHLKQIVISPTQPKPNIDENLQCLLIVGVNGVGKTTSIAKIAQYFKKNLTSNILLIAGDTFRAGAIEQLKIWGKRLHLRVVAQQPNSDPAAVIYDGIQAATANNVPLVIADTAGRLQNQKHLMLELEKIKKSIHKANESVKITTLLVVDASVGQNALQQAEIFNQSVNLDGFILSKCDSSARGGVIFQLCEQFQLPIYFLGMGEQIDDIIPFQADDFISSFLK